MPYEIRKKQSGYVVVKSTDGKVMGKHETKEKAKKQLKALYASEKKK